MRLVIFFVLITPTIAFAYVDSGAGHFIWQSALTGVFGLGFWLREAFLRLMQPGKLISEVKNKSQLTNPREHAHGNR